jgi:NAD(P)-dependent dehydrogenase (short-subunit alcohol dehydrogenase family)
LHPVAVITGADRGLGRALTAGLLAKGWRVFAGQYLPDWPELDALVSQYPDHLELVPLDISSSRSVQSAAEAVRQRSAGVDLLINNAGVNDSIASRKNLRQQPDYDEMQRLYNTNALGPLRVVEAFLPLMDHSTQKRLCFVSSEAGSIARARRDSWYGYCMSKAALNMGVHNLFNLLRPDGYTFRLYHPGWMRTYIGGSDSKSSKAPVEPEQAAVPALAHFLEEYADPTAEDRLVMKDHKGEEWPW